jgi:hypothetical protein
MREHAPQHRVAWPPRARSGHRDAAAAPVRPLAHRRRPPRPPPPQTLFPNITWNIWHVRCYTYWSGSLVNGTSRAFNLVGAVFQHLAGVRVYDQFGDGLNFYNYAPVGSRIPSNVYQLYVIEWVGYGSLWNRVAQQTVWNGVFNTSNTANVLTSDSASMILPPAAAAPYAWKDVLTDPLMAGFV